MTMPMSKRTLILVRHAKAEKVVGKTDRDRELVPQGRKDAHAAGEWLSSELQAGVLIDMVLCSTSERTRQTLDEVCAGGGTFRETRFDERIYDGSAAVLIEVLREVPDTVHTVLVIGHAPGIPVLATVLAQDSAGSTDAAEHLNQGFPTSGLAVLGFDGSWASLAPDTAYLQEFVVPRG